MKINIAIDGPAGSGKSTIAKAISDKMKIIYIDTGAMYRAVGLKAVMSDIDTNDEKAMSDLIKDIIIEISHNDEGLQLIFLNGKDVTSQIRTPEISMAASNVSKHRDVRLKLVELQQKIAQSNDVVMDGRDIGTYVLPDANFKFFLTADIDERATRRLLELKNKGNSALTFEEVKSEMAYRDEQDSSRAFAPLKRADDAMLIDTTKLSIEEVIGKVLSYLDK